jgi:hypothetical protein
VRLISLLTVSLLAATASADSAPLPFEVIRVLPNTKQVLVYDRANDTHVLLAPGSKVDDYVVVEISGVGLTLEKQAERLTVYPRAAKGLVMELEPDKNRPPVIYSKSGPAAAPAQVAAAQAPQAPQIAARTSGEAKTRIATDLASLLAVDASPRGRGSSPTRAAKLKP